MIQGYLEKKEKNLRENDRSEIGITIVQCQSLLLCALALLCSYYCVSVQGNYND